MRTTIKSLWMILIVFLISTSLIPNNSYSLTDKEAAVLKRARDRIKELQQQNNILKKDIKAILSIVRQYSQKSSLDRKRLRVELLALLKRSQKREQEYQKLTRDYVYLKNLKRKKRNWLEPYLYTGIGVRNQQYGFIGYGGLQFNIKLISDNIGIFAEGGYGINEFRFRGGIKLSLDFY